MRNRIVIALLLLTASVSVVAQNPDRHDVRKGNREFKKGKMQEAELSYRKGLGADTSSVHSAYNLASVLYRNEDFENAAKYLTQAARHVAEEPEKDRLDEAFKLQFNLGDAALGKKDYKTAVEAFMGALVLNPSDLEAKENYIYARKMLENQQQQQQQGGDGQQDQNQDQQNQDQNQQNQDQNQDNQDQKDQQDQNQDQQNQDQQDQDKQDEQQPSEGEISPQQAEQILQAIRAEEEETQDKVKKEKAAVLKSRQKDKNW